ncbi:SCAN domain-containing protein 3-like [Myzus persicae]|nr:SCAN domain-containing protein 3-like [Myzus persicae]
MQSQSINNYRFIMNYQDHLTKFVILKPLKTKRAEEIAYNLMEIYTTFGAPAILHSDNGREFVNSVINELHTMWGDVKIVHGKPRHSQSQGSIERANRDVEDMLATWMAETNSTDWPSGLKFIQFRKNRAFHSGIGRSPYEAMFGCPARLGVVSIGLPVDEISSLKSEEDIECILKSNKDEGVEENVPCTSNLEQVTSDIELVDQRKQNILDARQSSAHNLEKQALKMVKTSNRKYDELSVGTTVRLSIPDVDRARGSPRNVLAVVTEVKDDLYKLCTESGFLKHMYTRSEINPCKANLLDLSTVLKSAGQSEKPLSLREAATVNSISGAQGYTRCQCKTKCKTNRCACRSASRICNSKCHGSLPCENKNE